MFTADTGLKGEPKYGNRVPAVFVLNDKLYIVSAISGDPNKFFDVPTTVGKWMKIEICQHLMNNKGGDSLFSDLLTMEQQFFLPSSSSTSTLD